MSRERITAKIAADTKSKEKRSEKDRGDHRNIEGFEYDKSKAKVLKRALHNLNVSLGTLFVATKDLAMLRGSEVTPDGKLGGSGFIMGFRDMKFTLSDVLSKLSDITDTLADELTNPNWGLDSKEVAKIEKDQEKVDDKAEQVEEVLEDGSQPVEDPLVVAPGEAKIVPEEAPILEVIRPERDICPQDVVNARPLDSINRYRQLLEGPPSMDRTASDLGKIVIANLLRGDK